MVEAQKHKHEGNLQDQFLDKLRQSQKPITVFLLNGIKLQGILTGFDNFSLMLKRDAHMQLIYKHAVSTIMPSGALAMDAVDMSQA